MLVVRRQRAINYAFVFQVSKVEDGTPRFEEALGQDRDSLAETSRKKIVSGAASKRASSRSVIGILM